MGYLFGGLLYAVNFFFLFHCVRTRRDTFWIWILIVAPGVGSLVYFFAEFLPELRHSRAARAMAGSVIDTVNPERRLRELRANLEIADTADNRRLLAEELLRHKRPQEAEEVLGPAIGGIHAQDPAMLLLLAEIKFTAGAPEACLAALDRLQQHNPGFQSREGHMLYARALEMLGREQEAIDEYRALIGYALGPEAQVRLGLLLRKRGDHEAGKRALAEAVRTYGRDRRRLDAEALQWLITAERELAA